MTPLAYAKLAIAAVIVGALVWLGFIVQGWRADSQQLAAVKLERDQALADLTQERANIVEVQEASRAYQSELATLRAAAAAARPVSVVRLCRVPANPEPRPVSAAESRPDDAGAAERGIPQEGGGAYQAGPDIGPDLFELFDRADELSAQVRGLQAYALACSGESAPGPLVEPDLRDGSRERRKREDLNRGGGVREVGSP